MKGFHLNTADARTDDTRPGPEVPARMDTLADVLERGLLDECLIALGRRPDGPARPWLGAGLRRPVRRLAQMLAAFDQRVVNAGLCAAAGELLANFVQGASVRGAEHVPAEGPLLVAANHPSTFDALVVAAGLGRDDLKLIASGVDVLRHLPAASQHMIFVAPDAPQRMTVVRAMLRHLEAGGAVLMMASGLPDPDPDLEPGAEQALEAWSGSLGLALGRVPAARLVVAIVSGVLAGACLHHPLTRLQRGAWQKRKLAAFLQISQQLAFGRDFGLRPRVTFGAPIGLAGAGLGSSSEARRRAVLDEARRVLSAHMAAGGAAG